MGLKEQLQTTTVSQLNLRQPVTIHKTATVREAVTKMRSAKLGCIIAVDDDGKAGGIFTEGMLRNAVNESISVLDDRVENQMVARLPWVLPTDEASMVLDAMEEHNIRFIAVLDENYRTIGVTGQKTMMEFVAEVFPHEVMTQDATSIESSAKKEGA